MLDVNELCIKYCFIFNFSLNSTPTALKMYHLEVKKKCAI